MIIPNKITPFKESIISKIPYVLNVLQQQNENPVDLWEKVQSHFEDINEFILTLDVAFVLSALEYLEDSEELIYVI
ncbi:ABC-three component system middle component 7 [Calidifontibacillus oryziterrae]|uniref:ABC-three component system middle component 7 n=1 Tax=Calidifontibacillus oryziterrae TaxID=1191699 RepID=UPI00030E4570|nr:ABC-three component system middle component 7 [Calidifontibacillus oryziterrae]